MARLVTTYLEMRSPSELRGRAAEDPAFVVVKSEVKHWKINRFFYSYVGSPWNWGDKLPWSEAEWRAYAESDRVHTYIASYRGTPAGYFELGLVDGEVEILYFGLEARFIGMRLGGVLLTHALTEAWKLGPRRVWVHTCTDDHPAALQNYLARGMQIYRTETTGD